MFPTVEEYLLLDVLSNSDNNVQKAADRLVKMGYVKRDTPSKFQTKQFHNFVESSSTFRAFAYKKPQRTRIFQMGTYLIITGNGSNFIYLRGNYT